MGVSLDEYRTWSNHCDVCGQLCRDTRCNTCNRGTKMKYVVSRDVKGVSINGREYALCARNKLMKFASVDEALKLVGFNTVEEAEKHGIYIEEYDVEDK